MLYVSASRFSKLTLLAFVDIAFEPYAPILNNIVLPDIQVPAMLSLPRVNVPSAQIGTLISSPIVSVNTAVKYNLFPLKLESPDGNSVTVTFVLDAVIVPSIT